MKREVRALSDGRFDLLVVGGGVVGACVARDAALRGLRTALVERMDFGGGTSANCLKILHGGLRYLQHLDLRRARESLRERRHWMRLAPHLTEPLPVLVPASGRGLERRALLRAALALNDLVSWDRNRGLRPGRRLPAGRALGPDELRALLPEAADLPHRGGVLFHDALMYSPERIVLETALGAHRAGAVVANRVAFVAPLRRNGRIEGAHLRDLVTGEALELRARITVNAAGAAAPEIAARFLGADAAPRVPALSVAVNLVVRRPGPRVAYTLPGAWRDPDAAVGVSRRRLLVVPWRGLTLVGTGHFPADPAEIPGGDGSPREAPAAPASASSDRLVEAFLGEVNAAWPGEPITPDEVALVHRGWLPAEEDGPGGAGVRLLKRRRVVDHAEDGAPGALTAVAVKFTTARLLAEEAVDRACRRLGMDGAPSRAAETPLPGAPGTSLEALATELRRAPGDAALPGDVLEHLLRTYGREAPRLLEYRETLPDWDRRVAASAPVIRAQLVHGVRHEMAGSLDDLLRRRTELGARGLEPDPDFDPETVMPGAGAPVAPSAAGAGGAR